MNYFKILLFLQRGDKSLFQVSVEEQDSFLKTLGEAKDDIDRGFKQYLCQNFFVPTWKVVLFNVAAVLMVPLMVLFYLFKGLFVRKGEPVRTIIEKKGMEEVIPDIVRDKYHPDSRFWNESSSMSFKDIGFLFKLVVRGPHHPYFVLKAMMNVVRYSDMIRRHTPSVMIEFGEFSFSSSILTAYCHQYNVKHIDIMHGEKLWFIRDAYFHYDECYVWDEYYTNLFRSLKAEPTQFRVALPPSLQIDTEAYSNPSVYANYKYYLALYSEEQIAGIVRSMVFAKRDGKTVKYRPHPRYSDIELLRKYVTENEIEYPTKVDILESVSNLQYAVGSYTTVLSQAYFSGKKVILDDITYRQQYEDLKKMKYILSEKQCEVLSQKN